MLEIITSSEMLYSEESSYMPPASDFDAVVKPNLARSCRFYDSLIGIGKKPSFIAFSAVTLNNYNIIVSSVASKRTKTKLRIKRVKYSTECLHVFI